MSQKKLVLLIGMNGVGKTTFRHQNSLLKDAKIIDSDHFLIENGGNWRRTNDRVKAIINADQELKNNLFHGENIIWEFEAAGHAQNELKIIEEAHNLGYIIQLVWIVVKSSQLSLKRVLKRFKDGGIGGTQIGLTERIQRIAFNFMKIEPYADQVVILDNSNYFNKIYERNCQQEVLNNLKNCPWIFSNGLNKAFLHR